MNEVVKQKRKGAKKKKRSKIRTSLLEALIQYTRYIYYVHDEHYSSLIGESALTQSASQVRRLIIRNHTKIRKSLERQQAEP